MKQQGTEQKLAEVVALPKTRLSNADLVEGLINKDPHIATQFHRRFGARINRLVWRLLGEDAEHDDLVNQIFINILSSIKKLRKIESLGDWVDSITFRTVRKELRKRKYRRILIPASDYVDRSEERVSPNKNIYQRRFYAILAQMSADDRLVFFLRYVEGYSLQEIAGIGQYSLSTAKRRIKKAKDDFERLVITDPILASVLKSYSHVN